MQSVLRVRGTQILTQSQSQDCGGPEDTSSIRGKQVEVVYGRKLWCQSGDYHSSWDRTLKSQFGGMVVFG